MRITCRLFAVQADLLQQMFDSLGTLRLAAAKPVNIDRFADNVANRHARIERSIRILKDVLHLAAIRLNRNLCDVFPVIDDP